MKKRFTALFLCLVMVISVFSYQPVIAYAEDATTQLQGTLSNIAVSDTAPAIGDMLEFSCDITTEYEVANVYFDVQYGPTYTTGCATIKEEIEVGYHIYTNVNVDYYDLWFIKAITVEYANGITNVFVDEDYEEEYEYLTEEYYVEAIDMSNAKSEVKDKPEDTTAPTVASTGFELFPSEPQTQDSISIVVPVTDDISGVANVSAEISVGNDYMVLGVSSTYDAETSSWKLMLLAEWASLYQIKSITAIDKCGNETTIYNTQYVNYDNETPSADFSDSNFTVAGGNSDDVTAPVIDTSTLEVDKTEASLNENITLKVKATDDTEISSVSFILKRGKASICGYSFWEDTSEENGFYITIPAEYYGRYEILGLQATDVNGNISCIKNSEYGYDDEYDFGTENIVEADLSSANFNVGIFDENDSGVFVTGNGMDTDATLSVDSLEETGDDYDAIIEDETEDFVVEGFFDIDMEGTYADGGEKVKVQFDVAKLKNGHKYKDGDKIRIKHKRHDGNIDIQDAEVKNGKIWIHVSEFSPFLVGATEEGSGSETGLAIDETNFPDEVFRTYASDNFDTDESGDLSDEELAAVTEINVQSKGITDLTGLEHFSKLETLICSYNSITELDLSNCTALTTLYCHGNSLTALNVSNNSLLVELNCNNNSITELDLSNCTLLEKLSCNNVPDYDISNCDKLSYIQTNIETFDARNKELSGQPFTYFGADNTTIYLSLDSNNQFNLTNWLSGLNGFEFDETDVTSVEGGTISYGDSDVFSLDDESEVGYVYISFATSPSVSYTQTLVFNYSGDIPLGTPGDPAVVTDMYTVDTSFIGLPYPGEEITIQAKITNLRTDEALQELGYVIEFDEDCNDDSNEISYISDVCVTDENGEVIENTWTYSIPAGETVTVNYTFTLPDNYVNASTLILQNSIRNSDLTEICYSNKWVSFDNMSAYSLEPVLKSEMIKGEELSFDVKITSNYDKVTINKISVPFYPNYDADHTDYEELDYTLYEVNSDGSISEAVVISSDNPLELSEGDTKAYVLKTMLPEEATEDSVIEIFSDGYCGVKWSFAYKQFDVVPVEPSEPENPTEPSEPTEPEEPSEPKLPENGWYEDEDGNKMYFEDSKAIKSEWLEKDGKKYYFDKDGFAVKDWNSISDKWYYFDEDFVMQTGWLELEDAWYYTDESGVMLTGWQELGDSWYYFYDNGAMAESTWIGDCYVGSSGAWAEVTVEEGWAQSGGKWWYQEPDASYPVDEWKSVDGEWYYFDASGYMATGWVNDGEDWYYMNTSGTMETGWVQDGSDWYYMDIDGTMESGWVQDAGTWYYMNESGAMATGWVQDGEDWYYMETSGAMKTGWFKEGNTWYFMKSSGVMATDWLYDAGVWYFMDKSGAMKTGWVEIIEKDEEDKEYSTWYYMEQSGAMKTGWLNDNGTWYYLNASGLMVTDTVIDSYTIDENGVWVQ